MDAELLALCNQTVYKYAFLNYDDHNDFTWDNNFSTFRARVEFTNKLIRDQNGQEIVSTCQIYCNGDVTIDERDKIKVAGLKADPEILSIQQNPDENGNIDHKVIYTR
jgi:hypothetical protein